MGTSSRLKAFVPFDWDFFKKNRKEPPCYIYDDITNVGSDGQLMIVEKGNVFYVVRTDFVQDDLKEHMRYQKGFIRVLGSNFIEGRGVVLSISEGRENKIAFCNMDGQCIWIDSFQNYTIYDNGVQFGLGRKYYLCSLETFFSQGFVQEKASSAGNIKGNYLYIGIDDKYYVARESDRFLSHEDIKRKYLPWDSSVSLWGDGKIMAIERRGNFYQYIMRTEDYLVLPQGSCGWKDRALEGHFLLGKLPVSFYIHSRK